MFSVFYLFPSFSSFVIFRLVGIDSCQLVDYETGQILLTITIYSIFRITSILVAIVVMYIVLVSPSEIFRFIQSFLKQKHFRLRYNEVLSTVNEVNTKTIPDTVRSIVNEVATVFCLLSKCQQDYQQVNNMQAQLYPQRRLPHPCNKKFQLKVLQKLYKDIFSILLNTNRQKLFLLHSVCSKVGLKLNLSFLSNAVYPK